MKRIKEMNDSDDSDNSDGVEYHSKYYKNKKEWIVWIQETPDFRFVRTITVSCKFIYFFVCFFFEVFFCV